MRCASVTYFPTALTADCRAFVIIRFKCKFARLQSRINIAALYSSQDAFVASYEIFSVDSTRKKTWNFYLRGDFCARKVETKWTFHRTSRKRYSWNKSWNICAAKSRFCDFRKYQTCANYIPNNNFPIFFFFLSLNGLKFDMENIEKNTNSFFQHKFLKRIITYFCTQSRQSHDNKKKKKTFFTVRDLSLPAQESQRPINSRPVCLPFSLQTRWATSARNTTCGISTGR